MFGSQILEVAIGLIFIFILTSIICTVVREGIEAWLKTRAAFLERGIRELLHDKKGTGLAKSLYEHPFIYSLFAADYQPPKDVNTKPSAWTSGGELPSYIPTKNFALALMDMAARGPQTDVINSDPESPRITLEAIRQNVENLDNPAVQRVVLTALDTAQGNLNQVQANLEAWYDSGMDRVSGWYKRSSQWVIFWVGLFVAVVLNINAITIADYLSHNDVARKALVARAEAAAQDPAFQRAVKSDRDSASARYYAVRRELDSLELPIGWAQGWGAPRPNVHKWKDFFDTAQPKDAAAAQATTPPVQQQSLGQKRREAAVKFEFWNHVLGPVLGWLVVAFACMLGAPFWFDVLNKIMVIRSTVKPHEKSQEEASEDRQLTPAASATTTSEAQPRQAPSTTAAPVAPADAGHDMDGCDVEADTDDLTADEELPAAIGGVQKQLHSAMADA